MTLRRRPLPLVALALAASTALIGPAGPAAAAEDPTASVSGVTCVDNDGEVTVTVVAGDTAAATFLVLVNGVGGEETEVAAGASDTVVASSLEDELHHFEVILMVGEEAETLLHEERTVACDLAPDGPYSNPEGDVMDACEGEGWVSASNKPIGGNTEDLEPVTFTVTFTPTDDEVVDGDDPVDGGGEDPGDGGEDGGEVPVDERGAAIGEEVLLDTFVLDAETRTYNRTFSGEELGGTGDLVLKVGDEVIASGHVGLCIVLAVEDTGGGGGPEVVNTGA